MNPLRRVMPSLKAGQVEVSSLLVFALVTSDWVQGVQAQGVEDGLNRAREIIAQTAVLGAITIVVGVFLLLFGSRFFKATLFVCGFFVTALVGYILLTNLEPDGGFSNRETVLLLGSLACGVVGGLLALCLWRIGLILVGCAGGFLLGMFILSWKTDGVISSGQGKVIFLAVLTAVGGLAIIFMEKWLLAVATSIAGAYSLIFGIDCFALTGFRESVENFLTGPNKFNYAVFEQNPKVIALLCSMIALAIIGTVIQLRIFKRKKDD
ncbi:hypothetical protein HDU85_000258 [Gaertneriomyces sp. JEL0708]|nr:hypothetical protein HDU85_000258 [Gaertneriomyces sp. JEL0708]